MAANWVRYESEPRNEAWEKNKKTGEVRNKGPLWTPEKLGRLEQVLVKLRAQVTKYEGILKQYGTKE